jgi:hypothetical protein
MSPLRRGRLTVWLAALGSLAAGCASPRFSVERQPDGTQRLRCRVSLPDCLTEAERLCQGRHYVVLRAVDEHDRRGGPELSLDVRTSEALFRCGPVIAWPPGFDPMASPPMTSPPPEAAPPPASVAAPPSAAEPSPAPPVRACFPGSTQACVGPGGCAGGQACLSDSSAFGPCDCGAATPGVSMPR